MQGRNCDIAAADTAERVCDSSVFAHDLSGADLAQSLLMQEVDSVTGQIIGVAIRVHRKYGPGLLESAYTPCLAYELVALGLKVEVEKPLSLKHEGLVIHRAYVLDLLVEDQVIVEVKSVANLAPIHTAQLLTYLRLTGLQVGLILNFNVPRLVDGIKRVANSHQDKETD